MAKTIKKALSDRELMELSIEIMKQSVSEPRNDGKVSPKVGAVLLLPDGTIVTACRGELREGDHAEFTLIERKLGNMDLKGSTLFTTLEPCVERNPPKSPCCKRTSKARIAKVFVGIEDPDPTVNGKGIKHLEDHGIEVKMYPLDLQKEIESANKDFIKGAFERQKEQEESKDEFVSVLEKPQVNYDFSILSSEALREFVKKAKMPYDSESTELKEFFVRTNLLYLEQDKYVPSAYAVLLFGKNPRESFKGAVLKAKATYPDGKEEIKDFDGPLVLIPNLVNEWLYKVIPHTMDTSSFLRTEKSEFPLEILREAIVNALVHRDYEIEGAKIQLTITKELIKVVSPGAPLPAISLADMQKFEAPSLSRNPIITYIFNKMGYVEEMGVGLSTFKSMQQKYQLPLPVFEYKKPNLILTFPRSTESVAKTDNRLIELNLSTEELSVMEYIRANDSVSKSQIAEFLNLSTRTTERILKTLKDSAIIESAGSARQTKYIYKKKE